MREKRIQKEEKEKEKKKKSKTPKKKKSKRKTTEEYEEKLGDTIESNQKEEYYKTFEDLRKSLFKDSKNNNNESKEKEEKGEEEEEEIKKKKNDEDEKENKGEGEEKEEEGEKNSDNKKEEEEKIEEKKEEEVEMTIEEQVAAMIEQELGEGEDLGFDFKNKSKPLVDIPLLDRGNETEKEILKFLKEDDEKKKEEEERKKKEDEEKKKLLISLEKKNESKSNNTSVTSVDNNSQIKEKNGFKIENLIESELKELKKEEKVPLKAFETKKLQLEEISDLNGKDLNKEEQEKNTLFENISPIKNRKENNNNNGKNGDVKREFEEISKLINSKIDDEIFKDVMREDQEIEELLQPDAEKKDTNESDVLDENQKEKMLKKMNFSPEKIKNGESREGKPGESEFDKMNFFLFGDVLDEKEKKKIMREKEQSINSNNNRVLNEMKNKNVLQKPEKIEDLQIPSVVDEKKTEEKDNTSSLHTDNNKFQEISQFSFKEEKVEKINFTDSSTPSFQTFSTPQNNQENDKNEFFTQKKTDNFISQVVEVKVDKKEEKNNEQISNVIHSNENEKNITGAIAPKKPENENEENERPKTTETTARESDSDQGKASSSARERIRQKLRERRRRRSNSLPPKEALNFREKFLVKK